MKEMIYKLRGQSEEVRRHILHVVTFILAIILFLVWVYTLGARVTNSATDGDAGDTQPLSAIKDNFVNGYQSLGDSQE